METMSRIYCLKCRSKTEATDTYEEVIKGRRYLKGKCGECHRKVFMRMSDKEMTITNPIPAPAIPAPAIPAPVIPIDGQVIEDIHIGGGVNTRVVYKDGYVEIVDWPEDGASDVCKVIGDKIRPPLIYGETVTIPKSSIIVLHSK